MMNSSLGLRHSEAVSLTREAVCTLNKITGLEQASRQFYVGSTLNVISTLCDLSLSFITHKIEVVVMLHFIESKIHMLNVFTSNDIFN